jgi:hypothetical protein
MLLRSYDTHFAGENRGSSILARMILAMISETLLSQIGDSHPKTNRIRQFPT